MRMPSGECGVGCASMPAPRSALEHLVAIGLQRIDAQVERRRHVGRLDPGPELVAEARPAAARRATRAGCGASRSGSASRSTARQRASHSRSRSSSAASRRPRVALPDEQRQAPLDLAAAAVGRAREMTPERQLAQQREHAVGQRVAIARAERTLLAEEIGDDAIGRMLEARARDARARSAPRARRSDASRGLSLAASRRPIPARARPNLPDARRDRTSCRPARCVEQSPARASTPRCLCAIAGARRRRALARARVAGDARPARLERARLALPGLGRRSR